MPFCRSTTTIKEPNRFLNFCPWKFTVKSCWDHLQNAYQMIGFPTSEKVCMSNPFPSKSLLPYRKRININNQYTSQPKALMVCALNLGNYPYIPFNLHVTPTKKKHAAVVAARSATPVVIPLTHRRSWSYWGADWARTAAEGGFDTQNPGWLVGC